MTSRDNGRRLAIAVALVGLAMVQGCAVITGVYVPDRSRTTSHSMVSRYSVLHFSNDYSPISTGLRMPQEREAGLFYFRY